MFELIEVINSRGIVQYEPYSMENVKLFLGVPPIEQKGVHSIRAYRNQQKAKLFPCFAQGGTFVSNRNLNGFLSVTVATESPAHANLQLLDLAGVGFPVNAIDLGAIASFASATSCRVVMTPSWENSSRSDFTVYTIECKRLAISGGVRKKISG